MARKASRVLVIASVLLVSAGIGTRLKPMHAAENSKARYGFDQEGRRVYAIQALGKAMLFGYRGYNGLFNFAQPDNAESSHLFQPYLAIRTGSWPEAVAIGDVNNDALNDVVMTTSFYFDPDNDFRLHVFVQTPEGTLAPPEKYETTGTYTNRPQSVAIGDLNFDGKNDVVVGNSGSNIAVFFQNDSGTLDPPVTYATINSFSVKIGDLNSDLLPDVVSIGWGTNLADVFLQNSEGTLDPPTRYSVNHGGYDEVDVGDVNNDGMDDIVVMSGQLYAIPNIGILIQNAEGSFDPPVYYRVGENQLTHGVAVGDINNDSLQDVAVSYGGNRPSSFIGTFLQNTLGTLDPVISYPSYDIPEPLEIADVDLDERNDVVVLHGGWVRMGVFLQGSDGRLLPYELYPIPYASHYNAQGLAIGDINSDGLPDVVIADYNSGLVVLYHSP